MRKVFLVLDYDCNNHCISCAARDDETGSISMDTLRGVLEDVDLADTDMVEISGGEPTLRNDLVEIIEHIKGGYASDITLLTNGRQFVDRELISRLIDAGLDRTMVTLYGHTAEVHDGVTGVRGSFEQTLRGLDHVDSTGLEYCVKTIVTKHNYRDLDQFVRLCDARFPRAWTSIHGLIGRGRARENYSSLAVEYDVLQQHLEHALDVAESVGKAVAVYVIPNCAVDPQYWSHFSVGWKEMTREMVYISPQSIKVRNLDTSPPGVCSRCDWLENCSWAWEGAWKEYLEVFGDRGIDPIRHIPPSGPTR